MASEFAMTRRVEFAETDMAGIVHFSNYFRYMEECEHAFFRELGITLHQRETDRVSGWARRDARCNYARPLQYSDVFEMRLTVSEKRERSITYQVRFILEGVEVANGSMVAVFVTRGNGDTVMRAAPMPPEVDAAIDVHA